MNVLRQALRILLPALILAIGVMMYVLLDGFDLGVGMFTAIAQSEEERNMMTATVEPVWDGNETWLVLGGLLIGKPLGIMLFGWFAARPLGLGLPDGMRTIDLFVVGCVAAIGFTVSLFIAAVAFDSSVMLGDVPVQDAAKMGALFSFFAAIISLIAGKLTKVQKQQG